MDLTNRISFEELKFRKNDIKKIFFFRICGTGMGAAACLLKEKGYDVEGADTEFNPPMGDYLFSTGIPCHKLDDHFDFDTLKNFDLIVVGNVVWGSSEEARKIEQCGTKFCSFPAALGALVLNDINVIGIAGTHGKTTTTYLLSQMFKNLGQDVGYFVGGVIEGKNSAKLGDGKYFFIESDEYDSAYFEKISKFRFYCLNHMIITSLEFDHADIFNSVEDIVAQFREAVKNIDGELIYDAQYETLNGLRREFENKKWTSYGLNHGLNIVSMDDKETVFSLLIDGKVETFKTNIIGRHNILNLATGVIFAYKEKFSIADIKKSILNLEMVKRRQEYRGTYHNAVVIDDFAHHPRAVFETINTIKTEYPGKRLIVVMEPNSATARSSIFQNEFAKSVLGADGVIVAKPLKHTTVKNVHDLDCEKIADFVRDASKPSAVAHELKELRALIDDYADDQTVLLIMSNGTCQGLWMSDFVDELKK